MDTKSLISDYIELGIDSCIKEEALRDIPIVDSIVTGLKIIKNLYDRNLLEQTLVFLNEFENNTISKDKLIAHKSTVEHNSDECERTIKRILILLNGFKDKEKSIFLAKIYKKYLNGAITLSEFDEYSETIDRIYVQDIKFLNKIYTEETIINGFSPENYRIERLSSLGLIYSGFGGVLMPTESSKEGITEFGIKFLKIIQ